MYFGFYTCITELIHVFQILHVYYRTYTGLTELILVFRILYVYYRTYTCISDLTCILRNLYLSYGTYSCVQDLFLSYRSYTCFTELILVFRILFFCEGTHRYDKSKQIRIIAHTRSDQIQGQIRLLQIRTLVFRRYRSQIHYTEVTAVTTGLILIQTSRRSYRVLLMQNLYL